MKINKNHAIFLLIAIGIVVVLWIVYKNQEAARKTEERVNFERSRISTGDPLHNLAGCMANHATPISQMTVGGVIFKSDSHQELSKEEIESFNTLRNALYEKCASEHYQRVIDRYGMLTYPQVNAAFVDVMRRDPEVVTHMKLLSEIGEAVKQVYVK